MNPGEIRLIAEAMRDCGITHIKMHDLEMTCGSIPPSPQLQAEATPHVVSPPMPLPASQNDPTAERMANLAKILNLSDMQLAEQMFPEKGPPEDSDAHDP